MPKLSEPSWQRQLVIGLVALVAVGVIIGGIVAVLAVKAADVTLSGSGSHSPAPILPSTATPPTSAPTTHPKPSGPPSVSTTTTTPSPMQTTTHRRPRRVFTLTASPHSVGPMGRINLTGSYPGHDGATLQVQRSYQGGSWQDFPVTVTVSGDTFATYVETGYSGNNRFRVVDTSTKKASNSVLVVVQ